MDGCQLLQMTFERVKRMKENSLTDVLCYFSTMLLLPLMQIVPVLVSPGMSSSPYEMVMATDLELSEHVKKIIFGFISLAIFCSCGLTNQFIANLWECGAGISEWIVFVIYVIYMTLVFCILHLPNLFCILWMQKLSRLCQEAKVSDLKKNAKKCIEHYKQVDISLGLYFLFTFSLCQFFILIYLFFIIAVQIMDILSPMERVVSVSWI